MTGGLRGDEYLASTYLIPFEATAAQALSCSPPGDMLTRKIGHTLKMSGGNLIACGGDKSYEVGSTTCEIYNKAQGSGWVNAANELDARKRYAPSVQLDMNRIWMGRELIVPLKS